MSHPLEKIINCADGFLLIGDSSQGRFPAFSYHAYTQSNKRFYCLDMGGLTASRGKTKGGKVYNSVADLPEERDDLAIIWVKPNRANDAVKLAHQAGCKRVWFSFQTANAEAVARAEELGLEIVEAGRCPIYYLEGAPRPCRVHSFLVKQTGIYKRPQQRIFNKKQRTML